MGTNRRVHRQVQPEFFLLQQRHARADDALVLEYLDAPPSRVTAPHTPVPYSRPLENLYVPNASRVVNTVQTLING